MRSNPGDETQRDIFRQFVVDKRMEINHSVTFGTGFISINALLRIRMSVMNPETDSVNPKTFALVY